MSRGGAGSITDNFLRSVEAAFLLIERSAYLALLISFEDCIVIFIVMVISLQ